MEPQLKRKKNKPSVATQPVLNPTHAPVENNTALKEEILRWVLSITSSLLVYFVVANITLAVYKPNVDALLAGAQEILIQPKRAHPEPMEAFLFRLGVANILGSLLGFYVLFSKITLPKKLASDLAFSIASVALVIIIATLIVAGFAAPNYYDAGGKLLETNIGTNFSFYFSGFFTGDHFWIYAMVVVPLMTWLFLAGMKKNGWESNKAFRNISFVVGYAVTGGTLIAILFMNTFSFPYSAENKYDFTAVYYSMTQVFAGLPLLVDGFTNTYGLYPHFLMPVFRLLGMNVFKFSLVMSLLTCLGFVLNFYVLRKFVRNSILLFLGFATVLFFSYLLRKVDVFDCFFSFAPIRYIVPSVCVFLAALHFSRPSPKKYWITYFSLGFFVLWNPEIGLVTYLSWIAANCYNDFYTPENKVNGRKILRHVASGGFILPFAFYSYKLLIYLFYGTAPDLSLLWSTMFIFSKMGFNLLPMSPVHPWNTVALILIIGFTYAIARWHKKAITPRASIIFLLALIGTGYLFYFQGRSHNSNLALSSGFSILLLTILGDELWDTIKNRNILILNALFTVFLFLISFSFFDLLYKAPKLHSLAYQQEDRAMQQQEQDFTESNREFIAANSEEKEKIHIVTVSKLSGLYFDGGKRRSAFNPGIVDLFLKTDYDRFVTILRDSSFNIFVEPMVFNYAFVQPAAATFAASYEYKANSQTMAMLQKRKTPIPARSFFQQTGNSLLQRKYYDNASGVTARVNDAFGIKPLTMDSAFSVQALFRAVPQPYAYATIVGNSIDGKGFVITNMFNTSNYLFGFNDKTFKVTVKKDQWVYLAASIRPGHIDIFRDGELVISEALSSPLKQSDIPVHIGNLGTGHFYVGAISEVGINNRPLDKTEVQATWEQIQQEIGK